jgi:hypothetical protein
VARLFHDLWHNDDELKYRVAQRVLAGEHLWLEEGTLELVGPAEAVRPTRAAAAPQPDPAAPQPVGAG